MTDPLHPDDPNHPFWREGPVSPESREQWRQAMSRNREEHYAGMRRRQANGEPAMTREEIAAAMRSAPLPGDPYANIRTRIAGRRDLPRCACGDPDTSGSHSVNHCERPDGRSRLCLCGDSTIPGFHSETRCQRGLTPPPLRQGDVPMPPIGPNPFANLDDDIMIGIMIDEPPPPNPHRNALDPHHNSRAQKHMDEVFADLKHKSKGELLDLIAAMRKDWATLNEIHNKRANRSNWCTEYEERQHRHNEKLTTLKLLGRQRGGPGDEYEGHGL
jgi:hypothetical protein